ncbi:uncharacterized protein LOC113778829 [Coffea eugenioides]|uniref:uncharacterized protein LOC113778829 n=1 Tax=Coffea eugenioides TaxID=49369 RepID=UPI000F6048C0|nr:uncharacterized protein LOC113778829 [Coffea eugenioides]
MSAEELKIRGELEMDVERELEEEIKEGICHLAFRLQRLYQQQKERNAKELSKLGIKGHQQGNASSKILSEVNINIRMEGGTKIEIKEIKKQPGGNRMSTLKSESTVRGGIRPATDSAKKFDWAKSLRSAGPGSRVDCSNQSRVLGNKAKTSASQQQRKLNMGVRTKMLEQNLKK